jgi:NADH dehydrogenase
MSEPELHVVTGAFSYTGKYIARRLLAEGVRVRTITGHSQRPNEFGGRVDARPFSFENPPALVESLRGASVLYNTYWVRFSRGADTFERAIANTRTLIAAAKEAGVRRIVHVSIANATAAPELPYYRGKAALEDAVKRSRLSYAILRPAVIFGDEDVLINNIAWLLRRFPVFVAPGDGAYRLRPIFVGDMAELAVAAARRDDNVTIDAVGPETYTFDELLRLLAGTLGRHPRVLHAPPSLALLVSRIIGLAVRDVILTHDEVRGLLADVLVTDAPSAGETTLSEWLRANAGHVGRRYASEIARHYR